MISSFLQQREVSRKSQLAWICQLLIMLVGVSCQQQEITHSTDSTRCEIVFKLMEPSEGTGSGGREELKFQRCKRKICQSYNLQGECKSEQVFILEQSKCYNECCGSRKFDFMECEQFNSLFTRRNRKSLGILISGLSISITGVFVAVIFFACKFIKCCDKKQQREGAQASDAASEKNHNYIAWKPCEFATHHRCFECGDEKAFIMLPCGKMFHPRCISSVLRACPHCSNPITKLKLYCIVCLNYSLMVKVEKAGVEQMICEAYERHPRSCWDVIEDSYRESERKLTESTSGTP